MHSTTQWFINEVVPAFGRTLLHSLWLGLIAAILAGAVIASTRKSPAIKRYNGLVAVYVAFLLSVAVTFFFEIIVPINVSIPTTTSLVQPSTLVIIGNVTTPVAIDQSVGTSLLSFVNRNASLLVGLWALLFVVQLLRMAFGMRSLRQLRTVGLTPVTGKWADWIAKTSYLLGINQTVALLQSEKIRIPVALGFLKPVILVPVGFLNGLSSIQVEAILLHELAHIRRNDYIVNLMQCVADALFAFNPAVRWISARIREERETCCDATVVLHTANKKGYVEALVSFSQLPLSPSYAMAIGSNKTYLLNRVKTIITHENTKLTRREQATLLFGIIAMIAVGTFAFKPKEQSLNHEAVLDKKEALITDKKILSAPGDNAPSTAEKREPLLISKPVIDTIPSPVKIKAPAKWKSMSTNVSDDGVGKTTQVIAYAEDGTYYKIRKTNDEIVALSVNGNEIAKENYGQYTSVIDAIEQARKQQTVDALMAKENHEKALQQKQEMIRQKLAMLEEDKAKLVPQEREEIYHKLLDKRLKNEQEKQEVLNRERLKLNQDRKSYRMDSSNKLMHLKNYNQKEREYYKKEQEYYQKEQEYNQMEKLYNEKKPLYSPHRITTSTNTTVSAIISDLIASGIATNEAKLSFSLNNTEMMVNEKTVDKESFEKFKKRYLKHPGDSYRYFKNGGTTSTTINIE